MTGRSFQDVARRSAGAGYHFRQTAGESSRAARGLQGSVADSGITYERIEETSGVLDLSRRAAEGVPAQDHGHGPPVRTGS